MNHRDLIYELREPATTDDAAEALRGRGEAALEDLASAVLDTDSPNRVREIGAQLLGAIVPGGVERLLGWLLTAEGNDADLAAWGLRWNPDGAEAVLFDRLTHESPVVRANAARALGYIHVELTTCDARLIAAARDRHRPVRLDALRALTRLANVGLDTYGVTDPEPVRAVAREALSEGDAEIVEAASTLLKELAGDYTG